MATLNAKVVGPDGPLHTKVIDQHGNPHWLLPAQTSKLKLLPGAKIKLRHTDKGWYVVNKKEK